MNPILSPINYSNIDNDITSNGSIYKEVLSSDNEWLSPESINNVNIEYKVNEDNSTLYSGILNQLDDYLVTCITSMSINETSIFKVKTSLINQRFEELTDEYTHIKIKLIFFNEIVDITKNLQKIVLQNGTGIKSPISADIVNFKLVKLESNLDIYNSNIKSQLDNVEIQSEQFYKYTEIEGVKDTILSMNQNEICYFNYKNKEEDTCSEYLIELCDWESILMLDISKNIYAKITKKVETHLFNIPVYDSILEYQIADTYEELDNNTTQHNVSEYKETYILDKCMANMKIGEECILYEEDNKERCIRLLNITLPIDPSKLKPIEKFNYALEKKDKGNKLFKREFYDLAIGHYTGALEGIKVVDQVQLNEDNQEMIPVTIGEQKLELITCDKPEIKDESIEMVETENGLEIQNKNIPSEVTKVEPKDKNIDVQKLYSTLHLNISICNMKLNKYREVITSCKEVIKFDNQNPKLYYRLGYSYLQLNELDDAEKYLMYASSFNENNYEIKRSLLELKKSQNAHRRKERELYQGKLLTPSSKKNINDEKQNVINEVSQLAVAAAKSAAADAAISAQVAETAASINF